MLLNPNVDLLSLRNAEKEQDTHREKKQSEWAREWERSVILNKTWKWLGINQVILILRVIENYFNARFVFIFN